MQTHENNNPLKILSEMDLFKIFSVFFARMREEIKSPMGEMIGGVSLLSTVAATDADRDRFCGMITHGAQIIDKIFSDVVDFGTVASGDGAANIVPEKVQKVVREIKRECREFASGVNFAVRFLDENIPAYIQTDIDILKKTVRSLLLGFAALSKHGTVEVLIHLGSGIDLQKLQIEIRSAGAQPDKNRGLDSDQNPGGDGVSYEDFYFKFAELLVKKINGELTVVSDDEFVGRVAVISFLAKISREESTSKSNLSDAATVVIASSDTKPLTGLRVLLADDSNDNQVLLKYFLSSLGATYESANDGLQALDKALRSHFDVVLMDLQMPKMNGHQATVELRKRGYQQPVIALTAHLGLNEISACSEQGFSDFLERPISRTTLMRHILDQVRRA